MSKVTALIGVPAVGKSTIMKRWMARRTWKFLNPVFIPYHQCERIIVLGNYAQADHPFPGTDRMSMACQPHVLKFIDEQPADANVIFEGDRLGTLSALRHIAENHDLAIVRVYTSPSVEKQRFSERTQTDMFLRSRHTKVNNIRSAMDDWVTHLRNDNEQDAQFIIKWLERRVS